MNQTVKRGLALLVALVMCLGMLPALHIDVDAATYVYNWGTRGNVADKLSNYAETFYTTEGYSYESLAVLSGSKDESAVPNSALFKELHKLMEGAQNDVTSYDDTKNLFQYTDCENGGGTISSFYSGKPIGPSWDGSWNREHTWPNSKGDKAGSGENDIMMLRPTASTENSSRGNEAYGKSSGYYNPNSESNNAYDLRGDVARIMLYVYVRWECTNTGSGYNPNGIFGQGGVIESKAVLLEWMEADPVDTWEMGRNDSVQSITGTRNVFVDYPELAFLLFGEAIPANMITPSQKASTGDGHTHNYTSKVTAPSCTEKGYTTYTCTICQISYNAEYTDPKHSYVSGTCTVCGAAEPVSNVATLVTDLSDLSIGAKIIIVAKDTAKALGVTQNNNNRAAVDITKSGNTVICSDDIQIITLEEGLTNGSYAFNVGNGYLYAASSSNNYLRTETTLTANSSWSVSLTNEGAAVIVAQGSYTHKLLRYNSSSSLFSCYESGQNAVLIYLVSAGSGEKPKDEAYTVSFSVPAGVTAIADMSCTSAGITLPSVTAPEGYTFLGWVTESMEDVTDNPEFLEAGKTYVATADVELHALFSYDVESSGGVPITKWVLVTNVNELAVDAEVVIVATKYNYALSTTQNGNNRAQAQIEKDSAEKTVTINSNVQILTLKAGKKEGTFAFYTGSGYLYAAHSSKNYLRTETTLSNNSSWTITIASDGVATIKAQGSNTHNWLRYNATNSPPIFSAYASGQADVSLYMKTTTDGSGTITYYTTVIEAACTHTYDNDCDATCNTCGETREIEGHAYDNDCDASCNKCGATREIEGHTYDNDCDASCNKCGATREIEGHTYDNDCDADCNKCGATREIEGHAYDNDCDADCNKCGATREIEGHTYDNDCDATCNKCEAVREIEGHTYDNVCDADCNKCGATREIEGHTYDNVCDADCNKCGATREVEGHAYDDVCDADCNKCGATREIEGHTYDNVCDADCNKCGATREIEGHTYDNACDTDCNKCGATREAGHTYDNACDASCNNCGETREAGHTYDNACDASCNNCGATREEVAGHTYVNAACSSCGIKLPTITAETSFDFTTVAGLNAAAAATNIALVGEFRNNGDSHQFNADSSIQFVVAAGKTVTIAGHSASYGIFEIYLNGQKAEITAVEGVYTFTTSEETTVMIVPVEGDHNHAYIKSIAVATAIGPITEDTTITFGSEGNYKDSLIDFSHIQIGDNGGNNSQIKNGYFEITVEGANVTIYGYPEYTSYTITQNGVTTEEITDASYTVYVYGTIRITPVSGNNYFYSITIEMEEHTHQTNAQYPCQDGQCTICGEAMPATAEHDYTNACDTDCNNCGATREVGAHVSDTAACKDGVCIHCGVAVAASAEHAYTNACDTDCNNCGTTREVGAHVSDAAACKDGVCIHCGAEVAATAQHAYTNACDTDCNNCGATREADHKYANACDTTCDECGDIRTVGAHVSDTAACKDGVCIHCGAEVAATAQHAYTNACDTDCNNCGAIRTVTGHVSNATYPCKDGNCVHCGFPMAATEQHDWDDGIYTGPTETADGYTTYTCEVCGEVEVDIDEGSMLPPSHTHFYTSVYVPATCVDYGYLLYNCYCGAGYTVQLTPTGVHTAGEWEIALEATATEDGLKIQSCALCGAVLASEVIPALGEPQPTEPQPTEPQPTEPQPTEPQPTEPQPTEPQPTEPQPTEPQPTEPQPTEPQPTEPQPTEPQPTEPQPTEPQPTEPQPTEPQPTEPQPTEPETSVPETTEPAEGGEPVPGTGDNVYLFVLMVMMTMAAPAAMILKKRYNA